MQRETSSVYGKVNFLTLCAFFCFKSSMNFGLLCDLRDTNSYSTMYHLARYVLAAGARGGDRRYIEEMASIKACVLTMRPQPKVYE